MAISEMIHSDTSLWDTKKSDRRLDIQDEPGPISVQIAGYDPQMMAKAARANEERGADIIDINLGCPAKKVLKKAAGSALMRDEALCAKIFRQVVSSVQIPVTVKMRTGWDHLSKNGPVIAKMAEALYQKSGNIKEARRMSVRIQEKFTLPAACLVFGLIGSGLGVRSISRSSKSHGFGLSVLLIFGYYILSFFFPQNK